jgi:hypothetical protein
MRTQQQVERAEQQRIKTLVLDYNLRESEEQESEEKLTPLTPNYNIHNESHLGNDKPSHHHNRNERQIKEKAGQRVRKLQMSDVVDWYGRPQASLASRLKNDVASSELARGGGSRCIAPPPGRFRMREDRLHR